MEIYFRTMKLQKACSCAARMNAEWGQAMARKLQQRLMELKAAETLSDISLLPPARCHELTGNLKGLLSVDLVHPFRLIFAVANEPVPCKPDGGVDWTRVDKVEVTDIMDTH
jgi:proteic killer suppression protein